MKTILCFGDSNTWGYNYAGFKANLPDRFDYQTRWTGILSASLGNGFRIIEEALNARTTVFDDPLIEYRSGKDYLVPCLSSHRPLDLVIVMLGTNDLKTRFAASAQDVSIGIEVLIKIIKSSGAGLSGLSQEILIITPPPIGKMFPSDEPSWQGAQQKCAELGSLIEKVAANYQCYFADSHKALTVNDLAEDGLHLSKQGHAKLGAFVTSILKDLYDLQSNNFQTKKAESIA